MIPSSHCAQILDHIADAVIVADTDGLITGWNAGAQRLFGHDRQELIGQTLAALPIAHAAPRPMAAMLRHVAEQGAWAGETTVTRQDGTRRICATTLAPLCDDDGRPAGTVSIYREAARQASAAPQSLSASADMPGILSHKLINMLSPSVLLIDLLLEEPGLSEQARALIGTIKAGTGDATDLARRLGQLYRTAAPVEPLAPVDLRALMAELPALARHQEEQEPRPVGREIAFELQLEDVPPIDGNASELRQCLADLLGNAVDAMTQGGTICLRLQDGGDSIIATVQDSGRGMTEAEQTRCLEPFFTTKAAGAGLGLPLCAGIVARHRGRLSLSSTPGEGTACHLEFPVERTAASRPGGASAAYRILYIDDEPIVRRSMSMLLAALGHETDVAANGYAGIDQFKAQAYDVVISDFSMPGLTGRDVAAAIKALRPDTVVLLSTGWQTAQIAPALGEEAVEDGIIEKPVTIDTLKAALSRAMARRSTTRPG